MLLPERIAAGVAAGSVTLAFRHWARAPRVSAGSEFLTSAGVVRVEAIAPVAVETLTTADAADAGFASLDALVRSLRGGAGDPVYRIELSGAGPDPRLALGDDDRLGAADIAEIDARLDRLDPRGEWSRATLALIEASPGVRAGDLAARLGAETAAFKRRVRSLKALGLTRSLEVGYRLSPRGTAYREASAGVDRLSRDR